MLHRLTRLVPLLFIGVAVILLSQIMSLKAYAEARTSQAVTLSPASTEVSIDSGSSVSKSIDIINSGIDNFNITLTTAPYYVSGTNYDPHFTQLPGTVDASKWVKLSLTKSAVGGYKVFTIPYSIVVPQNTAPGGYYAVIFAETSTDDTKTGVVSHNRVGNILYITVNGLVKSGGSLVGSPLSSVGFGGDVPITTKITNSGGTHFITKASYTVTNFKGDTVFSANTERYVLPQTEREISSSWSPQSFFGIFTVHRSATIAGALKSLPDEKILIINPWIIVAVAFVIGILVGISVRHARRRRRSKVQ